MSRAVRNTILATGVLLLIAALVIALSGRRGDGFMGGDMGWAMWLFGLPFMILFWGLLVLAIVALVRYLGQPVSAPETGGDTPLDILRKRYARGEIGKDEFEQKKKDLV